ncbi:MAG: bile acid:sodium symporter [Deltaproteobacteria bacterium]|nr:bile acid:sodium symporter [Deltaproteobacteria bacterium]
MVQPCLMLMLLGVFWEIELKDLKKGFRDIKFAGTSLFLNFVWIPFLGYILAKLLLPGQLDLRIGFIMLLVTPCTDWYLIFTAMAKGNVPLSASILPLNLIIQLVLLPVYLWLLGGLFGGVEPIKIITAAITVLIIPLAGARILVYLSRSQPKLKSVLKWSTARLRFWYLCLAVTFMFASEGRHITERPDVLIRLLAPVLLFFCLNFILVRIVGDLLKFSYQDSVSLSLTTLARNSPVALTVAASAFPDRPLVALALIIGPLIELPVLGCLAKILLWLGKKRKIEGF